MNWLCPKCRAGFDEHRERCPADNVRLVENLSGRVIGGRWSIERLLGVGGGATVWAATGLETRRPVAIKLAHGSDLAEVRRFERGARISGMLDHAHITRVIEHGRDGEHAILVMELLEGETLKRRIARHRTVSVADAVHITAQVLDALDYAHYHGIVHRDIKPSNLFVTPTAEDPHFVKILDWGIAKFVNGEAAGLDHDFGEHDPDEGLAVTQAQQILGTPEYMAPEQIVGGASDVRSDIYAVGIVLYRLLAGHHPFEAKTRAEMYHSHLMKEAPPLPGGIAPALEAVVKRALAKKPEERWASAGAMRRALLAVMQASAPALGVGVGAAATAGASYPARAPEPDTTLTAGAPIAAAPPPAPKSSKRPLIIGALGAVAAAALVLVLTRPDSGSSEAAPAMAAGLVATTQTDQVRVSPAAAPAQVATSPGGTQPGASSAAAPAAPPAPEPPAAAPAQPDAFAGDERPAEAVARNEGAADTVAAVEREVVQQEAVQKPAPTHQPTSPAKSASTPTREAHDRATPTPRPEPTAAEAPAAPAPTAPSTPSNGIFENRAGTETAKVSAAATLPAPTPAKTEPAPVTPETPRAAPVTPTPALIDAEPAAPREPAAPAPVPTGNEIIPFGAGMSRPVRIAGVEPKFTREALEVGVQGTMIVRCIIELDGSLSACKVLKPVAHMETAVLGALATHRYRPVVFEGKPRRVSYVFNINLVQPK